MTRRLALSDSDDYLKDIDKRIATTERSDELKSLVLIRAELVKQNEFINNENHRRAIERLKVKFSIGAFIVGALLITIANIGTSNYSRLLMPGLFILGAGLYGITPGYVRTVLNRGRDNSNAGR